MARSDYPIDLRADYPASSSRGWAALTILLIKLLALIPHGIILFFLNIAQVIVAFIAQVAVAFGGEYPRGMFSFVAGVLRWNMRVTAFVLSLSDRYPPFTLQPDDEYPVDVAVERPAQHSRVYAIFTVLVELLFFAGAIWFFIELVSGADWASSLLGIPSDWSWDGGSPATYNPNWSGWSGLALRQIAALPHLIVLAILAFVVFIIWFIVQWVILFVARYPRGMYDFVAGVMRWQVRVGGYTLGLNDRYPPFSFDPSIAGPKDEQAGPITPPLPPAPAAPARAPELSGPEQQSPEAPGTPRKTPPAPEAPPPPPPPAP